MLQQLIGNLRKLERGLRMILAGIPILNLKGMRKMMFQLSGFCCNGCRSQVPGKSAPCVGK